ncbi:MAG: DUF3710 domain-containing protein [Pseudonocardia sp.]|nr:DUF3710 domain-containing protein [Pseudonocardia sp.]
MRQQLEPGPAADARLRHPPLPPVRPGARSGPHDADDLDPEATEAAGTVDFGAVRVPIPMSGSVTMEPTAAGRMQAVHISVPEGRLSVSALAAPKSSRLWPELAKEISSSLRGGGARVRSFPGEWGRELHAITDISTSVFVGVDGERWMLYGVATGPTGDADALDDQLRRMLRGTVVVRGRSPYPVRTVLPLVTPEHLAPEKSPEPAVPAAGPTRVAEASGVADSGGATMRTATPEGPLQTPEGPVETPAAAEHDGPTPDIVEPDSPPLWADLVRRIVGDGPAADMDLNLDVDLDLDLDVDLEVGEDGGLTAPWPALSAARDTSPAGDTVGLPPEATDPIPDPSSEQVLLAPLPPPPTPTRGGRRRLADPIPDPARPEPEHSWRLSPTSTGGRAGAPTEVLPTYGGPLPVPDREPTAGTTGPPAGPDLRPEAPRVVPPAGGRRRHADGPGTGADAANGPARPTPGLDDRVRPEPGRRRLRDPAGESTAPVTPRRGRRRAPEHLAPGPFDAPTALMPAVGPPTSSSAPAGRSRGRHATGDPRDVAGHPVVIGAPSARMDHDEMPVTEPLRLSAAAEPQRPTGRHRLPG